MITTRLLQTLIILIFSLHANAQLRLAKVFGDNMVLQRGKTIAVWGWAAPGEKVTVRFNGQAQTTKAAKDSTWRVSLRAENAGGPFTLVAAGKNTITLNNVLVGEVWLTSGQSNMDWPVRLTANAEEEIRTANFPMIRHFKVPGTVSGTPLKDLPSGEWQIATPQTAADFSAVSYYFARKLYNELRVPVGIINASWGGTIAETWISREALEQHADFKGAFAGSTFEQLEKENEAQYQQIVKELESSQGVVKPGDAAQKWKDSQVDDSRWKTLTVPVNFDESGLGKFDGTIWFRKSFVLDKEDAASNATLSLGTIDDRDETYINGRLVGKTDGYNVVRAYEIPAGVLREGENAIAVRVTDDNGNGGFFSKPSDINLVCGSKNISLAGEWRSKIESINKNSVHPNSYPSLLFNSMIHPVLHYGIRGALWYQGESNAGRAYEYRTTFPMLINDWRRHFNQGDFPFYFVQLAGFNAGNGNSRAGSQWAELREAQTATLSLPNTGMAVAFDIGETNDIHPRNKQDVGLRLAAIALNNLYGRQVPYAGPMYRSMRIDGNKAIVEFFNGESGLRSKDKWGYIRGFEIAGADKKFYYAQARPEGNRIVLTSDSVATPVAVRYAWADDMPEANLYNGDGFPAVPFRTDGWNTVTLNERYWKPK